MTPTTPSPISDQAAGEPTGYVWQAELDKLNSGEKAWVQLWRSAEREPGEVALYALSTAPTTGSAPVRSDEWAGSLSPQWKAVVAASASPAATGSAPTVYLRQSSEFGPWLETGKDDPFAVAFVAASPAASVLTDSLVADLRSYARIMRAKEDNQHCVDRDCVEAAEQMEWAALRIEGLEHQLALKDHPL